MNQAVSTGAPVANTTAPVPILAAHALLDDKTLLYIRRFIAVQPWLVWIPAPLLRDFHRRREEQFARLAVIGMPLLMLLMASDYALGLLIFGDAMQGPDRATWLRLMVVCPLTLGAAMVLTRIRVLLPGYPWWVGALSGLVLGVKLYLSMAMANPALAQMCMKMAMTMVIVVMLAMRLSVRAATATCLAAGLGAIGLAALNHLAFDPVVVVASFFGTISVCFFVAILLGRQDRLNFLQEVLLAHDTGELARLNQELEWLSQTDGLSGLANRRRFDAALRTEWERAQREGTSLSVVFADVDHFKGYNDTHGHLAGDDCLRRVGRALDSALRRPADLAARYGGEEFVILLPGTDRQGAREVAERALAAVDALRLPHGGTPVANHVTISVGLATLVPGSATSPSTLLDAADTALYAAKRQGRHRIVESPPGH